MYIILCVIILFNTISNYWDGLLRDVYGAIDCVAISDRVKCFYEYIYIYI